MSNYVLSRRADSDLLQLFEFGIERFGYGQAVEYMTGLKRSFERLADNPAMGRAAPEIAAGIRRHVYQRHIVLYEIAADHVLILAVVDGGSQRRLRV